MPEVLAYCSAFSGSPGDKMHMVCFCAGGGQCGGGWWVVSGVWGWQCGMQACCKMVECHWPVPVGVTTAAAAAAGLAAKRCVLGRQMDSDVGL